MHTRVTKNYGFEGFYSVNGEIYQQNPQRHIFAWK